MKDIVFRLTQFGFSTYESKAYIALLQKHPVIGYEVSKIANIPTSKIYETLTSLINKGAVISSTSEPVFYYPIDPEVLLKRIHKEFDRKVDQLSGLLTKVSPIPDIDITWNLTGYQRIIEKMTSVIQNARKDILVSLWPQEAKVITEHLVLAEEKGVHIIAGIFGEYHPGCSNTINLETCGISSQKRLDKRLNVVVGDSEEVVISEMDDGNDTLGIWATTPSIILIAKEYIKHDIWGKALVDEIGIEHFDQMCQGSEILSFLLQNR